MVPVVNIPAINLVPVFTADYMTIGYGVDQRYLEARWIGPVNSGEFRSGMQALLDTIANLKAELLLIDLKLTATPSAADQRWLINKMVDANQNTSLKRSARLFSTDILQHIVAESITEKVENFPYEFHVFSSETLAKKWLFQV